ncbi:hypothetical protein AAFC00_001443 [Neodothiora populina]|uniref:O-methyltransferase n=1 Tax=Neodothiora populina TaxID=2781224 RepID=A0ABR3PNX9_9PEZI
MTDSKDSTALAAQQENPRWAAVDHFAVAELQKATKPLNAALAFAAKNSQENGLPDIAVSPMQGHFLQMQCRLLGAKNILEVGTLGGYSTICLASSNPDARVVTVELSEKHASVAKKAFENAGVADRIEILLGPGQEVLKKLEQEVASGARPKFDFSFIDADKEGSPAYLKQSTAMSRQGACIIVDNVVRKGSVAFLDDAEKDSRVMGSRKAIIAAGEDQNLDSTVIQTVGDKGYDGFLMCVVR